MGYVTTPMGYVTVIPRPKFTFCSAQAGAKANIFILDLLFDRNHTENKCMNRSVQHLMVLFGAETGVRWWSWCCSSSRLATLIWVLHEFYDIY